MNSTCIRGMIVTVLAVTAAVVHAAPRDVQIRSIDVGNGIIELFNFGDRTESLSGWRFCTHDENEVRKYSKPTGLNGRSLNAGESFFVHFNDDAPLGDTSRVNRSDLGGEFALPLDSGPYGMGVFFATPFSNGDNIADHVQWSVDGADNDSADERSDEAVDGGVWTDQNAWIVTSVDTTFIGLIDASGDPLQGPEDYEATPPARDCDGSGTGDVFDIVHGFGVDDDGEGTLDVCQPKILQGVADVSFNDRAFSGFIDPRRESSNGIDFDEGIDSLTVVFSEEVFSSRGGDGGLSPEDFVVTETGGRKPPVVLSVDESAMPAVTLTFDRPITAQEWTTVKAIVVNGEGDPVLNFGSQGPGESEPDRIDVGFLPCDVDQNGECTPFDLLRFRQGANGAFTPDVGTLDDLLDTDRNGSLTPFDLLVFRQLVTGIAPSTQAWSGASMNSVQP